MEHIKTTDNNHGVLNIPTLLNGHLSEIANKSIATLVANNSDFLVFPQSLENTKDKISDKHLFQLLTIIYTQIT